MSLLPNEEPEIEQRDARIAELESRLARIRAVINTPSGYALSN
jgi:hypothetical protein